MFWTSWFLALLAVILAWPVPLLLARAGWTARSPFTAMVLWQAIALAGGLSMIGAMLAFGLVPLGGNLISGLKNLLGILLGGSTGERLEFWHAFALSAAALLLAHLLFTLLLTYARIRKQRRRHRELLDLLSSPATGRPGTVVINHDAPVAYCLPGGSRSVTVLSDGLMNMLEPDELRAVLIHENAHLAQRHHLLLWAFAAWRSALPWLPTSRLAQRSVNSLIEMLADDVALESVDRSTLVKAIALVASGSALLPASELVNGGADRIDTPETTSARLGRLLKPAPVLSRNAQLLVLAGSVLLLAVPTALLIVPGLLG
ncbi:M56 family metallopeptidase [Paenarthrobacter sp. PH39-S1]|uniref:M56 family metallopeptidase n=1 Tax=Paenarthrobacter sp. PH39-S1 TaxID=3046204 RepID=UPI0024BBDDFA|nr:M56 family metallopeptidase [Paenarthrobacter sp. PH39-S1]MDJ0357418.1 M56 family metallopeptidase [Paenarthrobacter sp. PH39-S1]